MDRPIFILGIPRSGTTYLHRLLATQSHELSSLALWEVLFAPALCQKLIFRGIYRFNLTLGNPFDRTLRWLGQWWLLEQNSIHPTGLYAAEEDYAALLCYDLSFLRVFAFPFSERSWRLTDPMKMTEPQRARFLDAYAGLLRRHALFTGKRVLSKNPSFVLWSHEFQRCFRGVTIVVTSRSPAEVVPSQLSSLGPALNWFGYDHRDPRLVQRFVEMLSKYYQHTRSAISDVHVDYVRLRNEPEEVAEQLIHKLQLTASAVSGEALARKLAEGRSYSSRHRYSAADFGLNEQLINGLFPFDTEQEREANGHAA